MLDGAVLLGVPDEEVKVLEQAKPDIFAKAVMEQVRVVSAAENLLDHVKTRIAQLDTGELTQEMLDDELDKLRNKSKNRRTVLKSQLAFLADMHRNMSVEGQ